MNPGRWREIRAAFDELVDADAEVRSARLAALGAADPELRQTVEALLAADTDAETELARMLAAAPVHDPLGLSGRTLSHFRVVEPLGAGGMGVVYAAEDMRLDRMVALKVPLPVHHLDASGRRRFLHEARSAGGIDHPNLCSVHEVGESEDGLLFLAMPLYPGETLRLRLEREGALPPAQALDIARQIALGLAAAHGAGIVHRDLKPGNVMLLPDGRVKILDFGLAKARADALSVTGAGLGTAAYMAPEQIRADPVDGRADLWALGVVLYEMVTGQKPFRGEHDASLAHAIVHDEPVPPAAIRGELPPGVEALILSLLAKEPAKRPATAQEVESSLAAAVSGTPVLPRVPRARRPALFVGLAALAVVGVGALALALGRREAAPATAIDADLVAIAPFDAIEPSLQLWREGLADVLARGLDGAGPLRTVPPSVALRRWQGRVDRPSAEALGARTGAGLVIFGEVVRRGADSVGIRATVLDRARGVVEPNLEVAGEERRMGELADSLGVRILRRLSQTRAIGSTRHTSIGSRSLPALREFLRGEQFYRRGEFDSALAHYDRSIAEDASFPLPLRRMYLLLNSGAETSWRYQASVEYLRRAVVLNRGLSPRDSMLLLGDSFMQAAPGAATPDLVLGNTFRSVEILEDLARRYPDDPSIWYELGERLTHTPEPLGNFRAALDAYDRAIGLDSGFAPAYMHTVGHAFQSGDAERARRYVRAYVAQGLPRAATPGHHFILVLLDSGGVHAPDVRRSIETAKASTLQWASREHLGWATDSSEITIVLRRELAGGGHDPQGASQLTTDTLMHRQELALALAFRGHLREAATTNARLISDADASPLGNSSDPFVFLALLGAIDDTLARRTFAQALRTDWGSGGTRPVPPRYLRGAPWWLAKGDSASLQRFAERGRAMAQAGATPLAKLRGRYFGAAAEAYLALLRGDSAGAVRRFRAIPDSLCIVGSCFLEKLTLARVLAAQSQDRPAARLLDRWGRANLPTPIHVLAALEYGRVAERLGDRAAAAQQYRFVVDAWRTPDPELIPFVEEARRGLARVGQEQAR